MKRYLLDTNVLSEVIKKHPAAAVVSRLREAPRHSLHTSSVSVMELRFGAARIAGRTGLWERIQRDVLPRVQVLPLGEREAIRAGEILAELEARGTLIGLEDVLIGATALALGLTVVTRNVRHLTRIAGLDVENWWD